MPQPEILGSVRWLKPTPEELTALNNTFRAEGFSPLLNGYQVNDVLALKGIPEFCMVVWEAVQRQSEILDLELWNRNPIALGHANKLESYISGLKEREGYGILVCRKNAFSQTYYENVRTELMWQASQDLERLKYPPLPFPGGMVTYRKKSQPKTSN